MAESFVDLYAEFNGCSDKEFWKKYIDSAFPYTVYGAADFIERTAYNVDTSAKSIKKIIEKIKDKNLIYELKKIIGGRFRCKKDLIEEVCEKHSNINISDVETIYDDLEIIDNYKGARFLAGDIFGNPTEAHTALGYVLLQRANGLFIIYFEDLDSIDYFYACHSERKTSFQNLYNDIRPKKSELFACTPVIWVYDEKKGKNVVLEQPSKRQSQRAYKKFIDYFHHQFVVSVSPLARRFIEDKYWTKEWENAYIESQSKKEPWDGLPLNKDKVYHTEIF